MHVKNNQTGQPGIGVRNEMVLCVYIHCFDFRSYLNSS